MIWAVGQCKIKLQGLLLKRKSDKRLVPLRFSLSVIVFCLLFNVSPLRADPHGSRGPVMQLGTGLCATLTIPMPMSPGQRAAAGWREGQGVGYQEPTLGK